MGSALRPVVATPAGATPGKFSLHPPTAAQEGPLGQLPPPETDHGLYLEASRGPRCQLGAWAESRAPCYCLVTQTRPPCSTTTY